MIACCDCERLPKADQPNRYQIPSRVWFAVNVCHPTMLLPMDTPTTPDFIVARPGKMHENQTDVYRALGSRQLFLHSPGTWQIWNNHTTTLNMLALDTYNPMAWETEKREGYWIPAHTAPTVGAGPASTLALAANINRKYAIFINDSAVNPIYLAFATAAAVNTGIRLNAAGGSYELVGENLHPHQVNFISSLAGDRLLVTEGT